MGNNPLISVIIPVYKCERYLSEAIASVLRQQYRRTEIIVVDDGSTDDSAAVAKHFQSKVRYFYQSHSGASAARNRGAELSKGKYLAFLDSDDIWEENKLAYQMEAFHDDPDLDIVFGHVKQFYSPELDESIKRKIHCPAEKMPGYYPSTMLIKRESFFRAGPFQAGLKIGEFIDWYLKAKECGLKSIVLPDIVAKRRIHTNNQSINEKKYQSDIVRILKKSLDRRRVKNNIKQNAGILSLTKPWAK
jgi:glycosyltransferase involved in cell wall biosynthesis